MKIVEITWIDIEELSGGWHHTDEVEEHINDEEGRTVKMVGYVFEEDEDRITLTDSFMGAHYYGTINVIPRGCIRTMTTIKE